MALVEDLFKGSNLLTGVAVALGAAVIVPVALPLLRPVAKAIIKVGLLAYDEGVHAFGQLNQASAEILTDAQREVRQNSVVTNHPSKLPGQEPGLGQIASPRQPRSTPKARAGKPRSSPT